MNNINLLEIQENNTNIENNNLNILFLGTAGTYIYKNRLGSAILYSYRGFKILLDAGEGCLERLFRNNINLNSIDYIFISHLHGDHYFGLFGLLQTMKLSSRLKKLTLIASLETVLKIKNILTVLNIFNKITFEIVFKIINPESIIEEHIGNNETIILSFFKVNHIYSSLAINIKIKDHINLNDNFKKKIFSNIEEKKSFINEIKNNIDKYDEYINIKKGLIISYFGDNKLNMNFSSDINIHECTYESDTRLINHEVNHSYCSLITKHNPDNKLILLTHFSQRDNFNILEYFKHKKNYYCVKDNMNFIFDPFKL